MFNLFEKKPAGNTTRITLVLTGLHCTSCAVNIDLTLEELPGVTNSKTNYARSRAIIDFEPEKIDTERIIVEINKLGYEVKEIS